MSRIIKNGIVYGGCTFGFQPIIYSTEEREVGVWKDGKPLYKKTLLPSVTSTSFTVNISALSVDTMVDIDAFIPQTSGNVVYIPYCTSTADYALCYYNNNYLKFAYAGSYNSTTWNITIYYTKTTDTAGSGTWTPQGIPAVHYVTGEHVIGTYTDGSTVYEQTYSISQSSFAVGWKWFAVNLTCSRIIDSEVNLKDTSGLYCYTGLPIAYQYSDGAIGISNNMSGTMGDVTGYVTVRYIK